MKSSKLYNKSLGLSPKLFKSWKKLFNKRVPLLKSSYMEVLSNYLQEEYKIRKNQIFPMDHTNIFRAFAETKYEDLKVVVIGSEPYRSAKANGIAFSCE